MKERIISAVVALPILLLVLFSNNYNILGAALGALSIIGVHEFFKAFRNKNENIEPAYKYISIGAVFIFYILNIISKDVSTSFQLTLILLVFTTVGYSVMTYTSNTSVLSAGITIMSFVYIPYLFSFVLRFYMENVFSTPLYIGYIFLIAFGSDTFAYFAGVFLGKRKVTPVLSPKKTLEGFIGGILGSILLTVLYSLYLVNIGALDLSINLYTILILLIIGTVGAMISQIGDLIASAIKRDNGIKDYGNLLPGHGGVLDRFDSILFVAPFIYYMLNLFLI